MRSFSEISSVTLRSHELFITGLSKQLNKKVLQNKIRNWLLNTETGCIVRPSLNANTQKKTNSY